MIEVPSIDHPRVREWMEIREPLERQLAALGEAALSKLHLVRGSKVLDIVCGFGATPLALAKRVGSTGSVLCVELLRSAIDVAASAHDLPSNVTFEEGDAEVHPLEGGSFDAVFSRFGVMFFKSPVAAFSNILHAMKPGGQMSCVCWRSLEENELDHLPLRAASPCLPPNLVRGTASASWFSFSDEGFIRDTLADAGWVSIDVEPQDVYVSTGDLQSTVEVCSRVGALGALLRQHPEFRAPATTLLRIELATLDAPSGPPLLAAVWIVTAKAPQMSAMGG